MCSVTCKRTVPLEQFTSHAWPHFACVLFMRLDNWRSLLLLSREWTQNRKFQAVCFASQLESQGNCWLYSFGTLPRLYRENEQRAKREKQILLNIRFKAPKNWHTTNSRHEDFQRKKKEFHLGARNYKIYLSFKTRNCVSYTSSTSFFVHSHARETQKSLTVCEYS